MSDLDRARLAVLHALRAQGCVCTPDVIVRGLRNDGLPLIEAQHDDWCPWLRSRGEGAGGRASQAVIFRRNDDGGDAA